MEMMKEMQRNIVSLTSTLSDLQENRGIKRKLRELDENPGTSQSNADFSDNSDEEKDEFDDVLNEVNEDIDTGCDNLLDEMAECFGTEDKCGEAIQTNQYHISRIDILFLQKCFCLTSIQGRHFYGEIRNPPLCFQHPQYDLQITNDFCPCRISRQKLPVPASFEILTVFL